MILHVKKKNKCNHSKCNWVKEAMEGEKPTTLVCTVLPINHTNLCYKVYSVCGKGFSLTSDFRLKFAKGTQRLVVVDEFNNINILIPASPTILVVPLDIRCDIGDRLRFNFNVLQFNQVSLFSLFLFFIYLLDHGIGNVMRLFFFFFFLINKCLSKSNAPVMKLEDISGWDSMYS